MATAQARIAQAVVSGMRSQHEERERILRELAQGRRPRPMPESVLIFIDGGELLPLAGAHGGSQREDGSRRQSSEESAKFESSP